MKIAGIIAEYNPFHNGHQYQIQEIRKQGFDYVIAVISGDFVQRGAPAMTDKYTRAKMALLGGVDLVLELPAVYATASAEIFARGGIRTLAATGIVDTVSFGMEQPDPELLLDLAGILNEEPDWYREELKKGLSAGLSYPAARSRALPEYADFLAAPNNILALEYAKAVRKYAPDMKLLPIQRCGSGYHQKELADELSSAGAIRKFLRNHPSFLTASGKNICSLSKTLFSEASPLANTLPKSTLELLLDYSRDAAFLYEDDLSLPLHCSLISQTMESLLTCSDMSPALASRILALRNDFISFSGFCEALKTKDLTYTRISRALLHLLLGITNNHMACAGHALYLRLLGFRRSAACLLGQMQKNCTVPLVTSLAETFPQKGKESSPLSPDTQKILQSDLYAHELYRVLLTARTGRAWPNEFKRKMLIVDC